MMRKINAVFVLLFVASVFANLLTPATASAARIERSYGYTNITNSGADYVNSNNIKVISDGSQFVAGDFGGAVDFDPGSGTDNHISNGSRDAYLTKYNADGSYAWTKTWGGTGSDSAQSIGLANDNVIYIVGRFEATVDFDPGSGTDNHISNGSRDAYLTKYNADGSYAWTKTWGGTGFDNFYTGITIAPDQSMYIVGEFEATVDFDPGSGVDSYTENGDGDAYLTKYNADGSYAWTKTWGGTGDDGQYMSKISSTGEIYIAGWFGATVDFDPGVGVDNHTNNGGTWDSYFTKYNADGSYAWTKTWGGTGEDWSNNLAIASNGDIYLTGSFEATVDFDPGVGVDSHTSNGDADVFLTKYTANGSYAWTKTWGGTGWESPGLIAVDSSNIIHIAGGYSSTTLDFDPSSGVNAMTSDGSGEGYVSSFIADGSYIDTLVFGGTGYDDPYTMTIDTNDNLFIAGYVDSTSLDFNPFTGTDTQTPSGNGDMFFMKLNATVYNNIVGVPSGLKVAEEATPDRITDTAQGVLRGTTTTVKLATSTDIPISDITIALNTDSNWSSVTAASDDTTYKSVVSGIASAPGVTGTHSLYIPKKAGDNAVYICPTATTLAAVTATCTNVSIHKESDADTSIVTVGGKDYWVVTGLTGTGGVSGVLGASTGSLANTGIDTSMLAAIAVTVSLFGGIYFIAILRRN